jgi:hypothetical protein
MLDLKKFQRLNKDLQSGLENMKEVLEEMTVEGTSGGGVVTAVFNGNQQMVSLTVKPEAVDPDDIEMLQDLVLAAVNQGIARSKELQQQHMNEVTGGLKMPNMPFF